MTAASSGARPSRRTLYWLIALPLAAVLLYFSFRGVDWRRVWQVASSANIALLLAACAVNTVNYVTRAVRWRLVLGAAEKLRLATVFWSNAAGYMANNFLPARTGEVLRSAMISSRSGLSKAYVLTTAISERLLDGLALMTISGVVLLTLDQKPAWLAAAAKPFAIIGVGGAVALVLLPRFKDRIDRLLSVLPLPEKFRAGLRRITEQVLLAMRSLHHAPRLAGFCSLTALIWFLDAGYSILIAHALGLSFGFAVAFLMLTGIGLSSAIPSTPGNVGVYQFVTVSVLMPFGVAHSDALAYALIAQALNILVVALWGLIGLWRYNR